MTRTMFVAMAMGTVTEMGTGTNPIKNPPRQEGKLRNKAISFRLSPHRGSVRSEMGSESQRSRQANTKI